MTYTEVNAHSLYTDNGNRVRTKNTFLRSLALCHFSHDHFHSILFIFSLFFISDPSFKIVFMVFIWDIKSHETKDSQSLHWFLPLEQCVS